MKPPPVFTDGDRNFDDLAPRFKRNVYDRLKGDIRQAVILRDLELQIPEIFQKPASCPLSVLDAGGGQGQLAIALAVCGHQVDLCDISQNMLAIAADNVHQSGVEERVRLHHSPIRDFCRNSSATYDLVVCHAVLEWVAQPQLLLHSLVDTLKPGGYLSLCFYNVNSIVMKNLLRGNFTKVLANDYKGFKGSLTPTNPLNPDDVDAWLRQFPLESLSLSGVRCFHDYILDPELRHSASEDQLALELRFSTQEPFMSLGRYIHRVLRRF